MSGILAYSEHFDGRGDVVLDHACRLGLEGIVSKLETAPLPLRPRQVLAQDEMRRGHELVIIGYVPSTTQRRAVGSLVVGAMHDKGKLVYAGRVGSGYSSAVAEDLWRRLEEIRIDAPPLDKAAARRGAGATCAG